MNFKISGGGSCNYALKKNKEEINENRPIIIGLLDMYYLPYLKTYKQAHIPTHSVIFIGYDFDKERLIIYDCDCINKISLSFEDLFKA